MAYLLYVSATHVTILRGARYKGFIRRDITKVCEPIHRCRLKYQALNFFVKERSHVISRVFAALVRAGKEFEVGGIHSTNEIYEKQILILIR
jgi:hypothetical protein